MLYRLYKITIFIKTINFKNNDFDTLNENPASKSTQRFFKWIKPNYIISENTHILVLIRVRLDVEAKYYISVRTS